MPATTIRLVSVALTVATLALTACAGADDQPATPAAAPTSADTASTPDPGPTAGTSIPTGVPQTLDFTARTIDGGSFAGSSLAGKPAVLWFWAAWCTKCRGVADSVAAVQRDYGGTVNLVGVAGLGSGVEAMRRFARDTGVDGFPHLADDDGAVWRRFDVTSQEQYVLLDSAGKVVHSGPLSQAELRRRVAELG